MQAQYSLKRYCLLSAAFLLTTPIGVAIGIAIGGASYSATALLGTEGIFNSISAGILLYNALVDFIVPTFSFHMGAHTPIVQALGFVFLFLGAGVMSLIALWA